MMFFRRKNPIKSNPEPSIWNGWTQKLITQINGMDRFTFQLRYFNVTGTFDGKRYAHGVRVADGERDDYAKMPLLFSETPSGIPKERYADAEGCARGQEIRIGVRCNLDIFHSPLPDIASKEAAGWLALTSEDLVRGKHAKDQEFTTPTILGKLYDPDGDLVATIRQSFAAAYARRGLPEIRVLLADKIEVSIDGFADQTRRSHKIKSIVTWETWGSEPGY